MSTLVGHFVSSPREREKRDRRGSRDEREEQGRKREMKESDGTEEMTSFPLYPYLLQGQQALPTVSQYQLDAPVTKATGHLCLTQPPPKVNKSSVIHTHIHTHTHGRTDGVITVCLVYTWTDRWCNYCMFAI